MACHPRDRVKRFERRAVVTCIVIYLSTVTAYVAFARDSGHTTSQTHVHQVVLQPFSKAS
ncbi:hypothetical protein [Subtercola endophyticus]|uniref:hypothetical protein n=1 Tax=Subtercola endophyticus TaxID=2895559 RepID=UPI001E63845E|nr:hypothetical protein [Subtercola endophyticus]UFS59197.1 hypothetical protein LQ955_19845 [Subtercola endophyticus]